MSEFSFIRDGDTKACDPCLVSRVSSRTADEQAFEATLLVHYHGHGTPGTASPPDVLLPGAIQKALELTAHEQSMLAIYNEVTDPTARQQLEQKLQTSISKLLPPLGGGVDQVEMLSINISDPFLRDVEALDAAKAGLDAARKDVERQIEEERAKQK